MRPPVQRQSALRTPLNDVFGTEGGVRLLRVLTAAHAPMSAGVLAQRARLDRSAARRALHALIDTGLVEARGEGRVPHYTLRPTHPLVPAIAALFEAERRRADAVLEGIQAVLRQLARPPMAVWLEGAVATETDAPGEPVVVRVVDSARSLRDTLAHLRQVVSPLEQALDVTIEVTGATPADLASRRDADPAWEATLRSARSLAGLPPTAFLPHPARPASAESSSPAVGRPAGAVRTVVRTPADLDARGLAIAGAIARRLRRDPTLVTRALDFVARRLTQASPQERQELEEWAQILRTTSPTRLRRVLVDPGERATRLRQTLPFLGVLTPAEREALLADAAAGAGTGAGA